MSQLYLFRPPSSTHLIFRTGTRQFPINQQELRCILREHDDTGWDGGWLVATIHRRTKTHDRKTRRIVNPPSLCIVASASLVPGNAWSRRRVKPNSCGFLLPALATCESRAHIFWSEGAQDCAEKRFHRRRSPRRSFVDRSFRFFN